MAETYPPQMSAPSGPRVDWGNVFLTVSAILLVIIAGLIIYARYVQTPATDEIPGSGDSAAVPEPETNPFTTDTNPLSNTYENPFK